MLVRAFPRARVVVIATGALPFAVPLAARVKFTVAGLAETVSDSASIAFKATVAVFELEPGRLRLVSSKPRVPTLPGVFVPS